MKNRKNHKSRKVFKFIFTYFYQVSRMSKYKWKIFVIYYHIHSLVRSMWLHREQLQLVSQQVSIKNSCWDWQLDIHNTCRFLHLFTLSSFNSLKYTDSIWLRFLQTTFIRKKHTHGISRPPRLSNTTFPIVVVVVILSCLVSFSCPSNHACKNANRTRHSRLWQAQFIKFYKSRSFKEFFSSMRNGSCSGE